MRGSELVELMALAAEWRRRSPIWEDNAEEASRQWGVQEGFDQAADALEAVLSSIPQCCIPTSEG